MRLFQHQLRDAIAIEGNEWNKTSKQAKNRCNFTTFFILMI
jgi:hypothetical protein